MAIRNMPGQDILQQADLLPRSRSYLPGGTHGQSKTSHFRLMALCLLFPHRWPGKWFDDTKTTSGSAVISTTAGQLSCGDVGQAIQINGAGAGGGL